MVLVPKYRQSFPYIFFPFLYNPPFKPSNIHFHASSFGEVKSITPFIDIIKNDINISTMTNTGFKEAKKLSKNVRYIPFDIFNFYWVKKQKALIVVDADLWYLMFYFSKLRGNKNFLINARMSKNSLRKKVRLAYLYKAIFKNIDNIYVQSKEDIKRFHFLGAKNVELGGNIKTLSKVAIKTNLIKTNKKLIIAGSTHKNEENIIIKNINFRLYSLVVAPRHPERFKEVDTILKNYSKEKNISYSTYSKDKSLKQDLILLDTLGVLNSFYKIADLVILGGAFIKKGGHNPLEPAFFNCPIISGEHYYNQKSLFKLVENIQISTENNLEKNIEYMIENNITSNIKKDENIQKIVNLIKKYDEQ